MRRNLPLIALVALLISCDGGVRGTVHVSGDDGAPINNATIEIDRGGSNMTDQTDHAGNAKIGAVVSPSDDAVPVYVGKGGFVPCAVLFPTRSKQEAAVTLSTHQSGHYTIAGGAPTPCGAVPAGWSAESTSAR